MGGVVSSGADNDELIDKLKEADYIKDPNIERVFRLVDRANYLTQDNQNVAYSDNAWKCGNLHLSAPCIYAQVMEGLKLGDGMSFLNIGSGTGYLSTMAGLLIGSQGVNHGVEIHNDVVIYARDRLSWFLNNCGAIDVTSFCEPRFVQGNVFCLSEEMLPYDRVYVGASCPRSHENYMKNLLKVGGILVMPRNEHLLKITRTTLDKWSTEILLPVSFSMLMGTDKLLQQERVTLPSNQIASLQEMCREVIRSVLRERVECENIELRNSFCHPIDVNPKPARTRVIRRMFPSPPLSDDESEVGETLYHARHRTAEQIMSFFNMAIPTEELSSDEDSSMDEEEETTDDNANDDLSVTNSERITAEELTIQPATDTQEDIGRVLDEIEAVERVIDEIVRVEREFEEDLAMDSDATEYNGSVINIRVADEEGPSTSSDSKKVSTVTSRIPSCDKQRSSRDDDDDQAPNKREKFDNSICEDVERRETTASSDHSAPIESEEEKNLKRKQQRRSRRKRRNRTRFTKPTRSCSSGSNSSSIECPSQIYTRLLKVKVQQLPLPNPLKVFVNYSRPL